MLINVALPGPDAGMRIRVAIYANRLEVENPGMLPFGMTLDDLKAGVSRIRNRVIVRVLRELGLEQRRVEEMVERMTRASTRTSARRRTSVAMC